MRRELLLVGVALLLASLIGCSPSVTSEEVLFENPIADLAGLLTRSGVELDTETSSDGNGSLKIVAGAPTGFADVAPLATGVVDIADAIPGARGERFADAGHMGPLTHPGEVNGAIRKFLRFPSADHDDAIAYTPMTARAA